MGASHCLVLLVVSHRHIIEAGILTLQSYHGGRYNQGDVVEILSDDIGKFGKVVVISTEDLQGAISFSLIDGGSWLLFKCE